ncbi:MULTISPECIES: hypothetical protein [Bacillaceae]|uniref:GerMN domain-containing protein n=1 Tax=Evansella alkalicola TaxID=745819 RepID=A0ABS6JNB9_9BACI|nr:MULTISPECIES: hypothetical protein [Bacillaceae]MBU9720056.1 hypothetical protein [Bacillus alkalicola]
MKQSDDQKIDSIFKNYETLDVTESEEKEMLTNIMSGIDRTNKKKKTMGLYNPIISTILATIALVLGGYMFLDYLYMDDSGRGENNESVNMPTELPPSAFVEIQGLEYEMVLGGYSWVYNNQATSTTQGKSIYEKLEENGFEPILVSPGEEISFKLNYQPEPDTFSIFKYTENNTDRTYEHIEKLKFTLPEEDGTYYYHFEASWLDEESGFTSSSASYFFSVEVSTLVDDFSDEDLNMISSELRIIVETIQNRLFEEYESDLFGDIQVDFKGPIKIQILIESTSDDLDGLGLEVKDLVRDVLSKIDLETMPDVATYEIDVVGLNGSLLDTED